MPLPEGAAVALAGGPRSIMGNNSQDSHRLGALNLVQDHAGGQGRGDTLQEIKGGMKTDGLVLT